MQNVCVHIKLKCDGWSIEWFDTDSGERWLIERGYESRAEAARSLVSALEISERCELDRRSDQ